MTLLTMDCSSGKGVFAVGLVIDAAAVFFRCEELRFPELGLTLPDGVAGDLELLESSRIGLGAWVEKSGRGG